MTERPILFSGPMVRAILKGRKTQIRRVIKQQPPEDVAPITVSRYHPTIIDRYGDEAPGVEIFGAYSADGAWGCKCPHGEPRDRLWVRETAACGYRSEHPPCEIGRIGVDYKAGGSFERKYTLDRRDNYPWFPRRSHNVDGSIRWAPGIHMPRWASRITLEITGVRVERLQDISEQDATAEGVESLRNEGELWKDYLRSTARCDELLCLSASESFRTLWDSINATRGHDWNTNPWVWVIEFRSIKP